MKRFQLERNSETAMNGLRNYLKERGVKHGNDWYFKNDGMSPKFCATLESSDSIMVVEDLFELEKSGVQFPEGRVYSSHGARRSLVYRVNPELNGLLQI